MQKTLFFSTCLLFFSFLAQAQGCSDAGFCTMGAMKPDQKFHKKANFKLRAIEISQYYGYTKFDDHIVATNIDFNIGIGKKNTLQFKLPYQMVYGPLANTAGLGDISLSFSHTLFSNEKYQIAATIGAKIPTNNGNKTANVNGRELPLPAYYQTSLGTYDLVLGTSLITRKWLVGVGLQYVVINENYNAFLWGVWRNPPSELTSIANKYPVSKALNRGTDVMLRIERNFRFSNYNFNIGLLPIYRLNKDYGNFVNKEGKQVRGEMEGTEGLALSLLAGAGYNFSVNSSIKLMTGWRVLGGISRDKNADGLSREMVATVGYEFRF
jgi:hypothetical protein